MLQSAIFAALASATPQQPGQAVAHATVRIERSVAVRARQWEQVPEQMRREALVVGEDGRPVLLRLVEMP